MAESFAEYVKYHRSALGLTQGELAEKSKISQSYVSGLERGINKEPDRDIVISLAGALGRPKKEALAVVGYSESSSPRESEIEYLVNFDDLTPEGMNDFDELPREVRDRARAAATEAAKNTFRTVADALRHVRRVSPGTVRGAGPVRTDDEEE